MNAAFLPHAMSTHIEYFHLPPEKVRVKKSYMENIKVKNKNFKKLGFGEAVWVEAGSLVALT